VEQVQTIIESFTQLYSVVAGSTLATTIMISGLVLIAITAAIGFTASRSEPDEMPLWMKVAFFVCLFFGVLLVAGGPAVSWTERTRGGIAQVPKPVSFANLGENAEVTWLIRLVPYTPGQKPDLSVSHLTNIGPDPSIYPYAFVSSYHELKGYKVSEAVRMVGATMTQRQHVSAIIFPKTMALIPANARGVLQILADIQNDQTLNQTTIFDINAVLSDAERSNLSDRDTRPTWKFDNYKGYYTDFCNAVRKIECVDDYSVKGHISINSDWNPLGFAREVPAEHNICDPVSYELCSVADWSAAVQRYGNVFGSRVFLIKNLPIAKLENPYLIDFEDPDNQYIPDIGVGAP
jgi:hypothetical protein